MKIGGKMPCDSGMGGGYNGYYERQEIDKLTRLLCALCKQLEDSAGKSITFEDADLNYWWQNHKKLDAEKQRQAAIEKHKVFLRNQARAKLTPEELDALLNK